MKKLLLAILFPLLLVACGGGSAPAPVPVAQHPVDVGSLNLLGSIPPAVDFANDLIIRFDGGIFTVKTVFDGFAYAVVVYRVTQSGQIEAACGANANVAPGSGDTLPSFMAQLSTQITVCLSPWPLGLLADANGTGPTWTSAVTGTPTTTADIPVEAFTAVTAPQLVSWATLFLKFEVDAAGGLTAVY